MQNLHTLSLNVWWFYTVSDRVEMYTVIFSFHVAFKFLQTLYMYNTVQVMSQQHQVITHTGSLSMSLQEQISTKL